MTCSNKKGGTARQWVCGEVTRAVDRGAVLVEVDRFGAQFVLGVRLP